MLVVLSPAKKLDAESPADTDRYSQPRFMDEAKALACVGKTMGAARLQG
ncbi:hypothetical protein [Iodidimonas gelatinilytica]|nr:hypothetical protein [Iodidimonas gelatinilytica]